MTLEQYAEVVRGGSAVRRGTDFAFAGVRYQVKANRPSGKRGSFVTLVPKAKNYEWDRLIWILYNRTYEIQEAWEWDAGPHQAAFHVVKRLGPVHYRQGRRLK